MKRKLGSILVICLLFNITALSAYASGVDLKTPTEDRSNTNKIITVMEGQGNFKPLYGLNFSPYLESQSPDQGSKISEEQIKMRLQLVKPYTQWVRTFSCSNGLEKTGKIAHSMGFKTLIGADIGKNRGNNEKEIEAVIKIAKAGDADIVAIGNEVLLRGDLKESQLIKYIKKVKKEVKKKNSKIKVSTVDGYYLLLKHPKVMEVCDVILTNCYPFWEGCKLEDSIASLNNMYERVKKAAKGKEVIIAESGWPSDGNRIGGAIPSKANGQYYLKSFLDWAGKKNVKYFYFTGFDESWKAVHEGTLGAYWGIFDNNGKFKYNLDKFSGLSVITMPEGSALPIDGIFIPSGYMGNLENIKMEKVVAKSGSIRNYLKITLVNKSQGNGWSGIYWQYPANNWGNKPGLNLYLPKRLTFNARGEKGGEKTEFKIGGISGDFTDTINPAVSTGEIELTSAWKQYSINLEGKNLESVIGGFCCAASKDSNPDGCAIFLSNIRFEW